MKIITRILVFPFIACIMLIWSLKVWFKANIEFLRYGGEFVRYDKTVNNIHVWDIYNELTQQRSDYKKAYNEGIDKASDESQMDFNDFKLK